MNTTQLKVIVRKITAQNHGSAQVILIKFLLDDWLERISVSRYRNNFVLKGGMLISNLVGIASRTTMDMDVTLRNYPLSEIGITASLTEICGLPSQNNTER